jgi:hypothetical protein
MHAGSHVILLFIGPLWLLGPVFSQKRRQFVVEITDRTLQAAEVMIQGYGQRRSARPSIGETQARVFRPAA